MSTINNTIGNFIVVTSGHFYYQSIAFCSTDMGNSLAIKYSQVVYGLRSFR